LKQK
jgi:CspA family cold shock protein